MKRWRWSRWEQTEEDEEVDLPPVLHNAHAWEAPRLRALDELLGVELQPEEPLLEAVEAPWREESDEVSSGDEVEGHPSLQPCGLTPNRMRGESRGLDGRGKQQQKKRGDNREEQGRRDRGEASGACQGPV